MRGFVSPQRLSLGRKMLQINWGLILIVTATAAIGVAMLYSAANGSWNPWATRQIARYAVGLVILITVALVDIRLCGAILTSFMPPYWRCWPRSKWSVPLGWGRSAGLIWAS